jgi:hypothetical protein
VAEDRRVPSHQLSCLVCAPLERLSLHVGARPTFDGIKVGCSHGSRPEAAV